MTNPYGKKQADNISEESPAKITAEKSKTVSNKKKIKKKLLFTLLKPLILMLVNLIWLSCRVKIVGQDNMDKVVNSKKPVIPCYWHQQHLFCGWYMLKQIRRGMKIGFLVSPSSDGDIPAKIVSSRGASVIRGSSTRTGAQALRDMYQIIVKDGISPVTTSDGPTGPIFKFKPGAVMLSQMTAAPMLPVAYAAKSAWSLGSWDRFIIPKPFTRIVVAVGEQVSVDKEAIKDMVAVQQQMEDAINAMVELARQQL